MPDRSPESALVVAAHGRRGLVEWGGHRQRYVAKGRDLKVVCGDRVCCESRPGSEDLLVTSIAPRTNTLARLRQHESRSETLAANLTQVIAVCAPVPEPDFFLLDRYLCAAELMGCKAVLLWNKCDISPPSPALLAEYAALDCRVTPVSARHGDHLAILRTLLAGETSVLVGQSGVGKSSLVNGLVAGDLASVGELSAATSTGTHTTTAVLMYTVDGESSGRLLDTPGVRDFVPAIDRDRRLDLGFPEMRPFLGLCRFSDCQHLHEPGCAVKQALASGAVSQRRYESYCRLLVSITGARRGEAP